MKKVFAMLGVMLLTVAAGAQTNMALPAGTAFKVKLENTLSTFSSKEGDSFSGRVIDAVVLDGKTVIPVGATGTVLITVEEFLAKEKMRTILDELEIGIQCFCLFRSIGINLSGTLACCNNH